MDDDTLKTTIMIAIFGALALALMLARLLLRRYRQQALTASDYLTMAAIVCLAARSALTTVVVLWGNNNLSAAYRVGHAFGALEVYERVVGSKLTLVNRVVYNTYIWIQKGVVLLLYQRILQGLTWPKHIINFYWGFLGVTYAVAQVVAFVECRPFYLYWQVVPDPGNCPQAPVQLITFVALNIATDLGLIILPMPWLFKMKRSLRQRLSLAGLFSIGFLLIAIAFARLPIYGNGTSQVNRNTWGSVEAFAAAFVANVPTLFALRYKPQNGDSTLRSMSQSQSQSHRQSDTTGLRQLRNDRITVTNSVELTNDAIEDLKMMNEHREKWDRAGSHESLVRVTSLPAMAP